MCAVLKCSRRSVRLHVAACGLPVSTALVPLACSPLPCAPAGGITARAHSAWPMALCACAGWCVVRDTAAGRTVMHYVAQSDVRGWLPLAVVNAAMASNFRAFFQGLTARLRDASAHR